VGERGREENEPTKRVIRKKINKPNLQLYSD